MAGRRDGRTGGKSIIDRRRYRLVNQSPHQQQQQQLLSLWDVAVVDLTSLHLGFFSLLLPPALHIFFFFLALLLFYFLSDLFAQR